MMAGCVEGPENNVCLRRACIRVIVLVCCYGSFVQSSQSPAKVVTGGNLIAMGGDSVTFRCEVHGGEGSRIIMVEWTRCDRGVEPRKVLVFMPSGSNLSLSDTHQGRVTMTTASNFTLRNVSMEDFGLYCCKLNVFPDGVLQAEVQLSEGTGEEDHAASQRHTLFGLPPQIVYTLGGVVCGVMLVVVVTTVIVCKKHRVQLQDYVNVSVHQRNVPKGPEEAGEENTKGAEKARGARENIKSAEENIKSAEENNQIRHPMPDHVERLSHLSGSEEAEMTMQQHAT